METDFTEEAKTYSLDELYDVKANINREKYPERFAFVIQRIEELEKSESSAAKRVGPTSPELGLDKKSLAAFVGDGSGVFSRTVLEPDEKIIPAAIYNAVMGVVLLYGFAVNYWMVRVIDPAIFGQVSRLIFLIAYFASCFLGVYLFTKSDSPWVSFVGYSFVVVPFGVVLNLFVSQYDPRLVLSAVYVTGAVTLGMMLAGMAFPAIFSRLERSIFLCLLLVVGVEWFGIGRGLIDTSMWNIGVALIFCGYIGLDWGRANRIPKTMDNAVDSAAALYMDIINLFVRILSVMGKKK